MHHVFKFRVMHLTIVTDRDHTFTSSFSKEIFLLQGTHLHYSSAYRPQFDGQTKIVNKCAQRYLCCSTGDRPKKWTLWFPWVEWWYNTNYHSSSHLTPFEALYGVSSPTLV